MQYIRLIKDRQPVILLHVGIPTRDRGIIYFPININEAVVRFLEAAGKVELLDSKEEAYSTLCRSL